MLGDLKDRTLAGYDKLGKPSVNDQQVLGREAVVGGFMGSVKVEPVRGSRLVRVTVVSPDAAKAARVANAMAQNFMVMSMERKMESSVYARNFLEDQIKVTKARLEESERTLNAYARANSILTLDEKTSVINQSYTELSSALAKLEQDRLKAEAQYTEMARNPREFAPGAGQQDGAGLQGAKGQAGGRVPGEPGHLQARVSQDAADQGADQRAGPAHQGRDGRRCWRRSRRSSTRPNARKTRCARACRTPARKCWLSQDRGVDLSLLKRELDTNRQIYDNLLQRLKEVGVTSGVTTNNISVVDVAKAPLFPFKPDLMTNAGDRPGGRPDAGPGLHLRARAHGRFREARR